MIYPYHFNDDLLTKKNRTQFLVSLYEISCIPYFHKHHGNRNKLST